MSSGPNQWGAGDMQEMMQLFFQFMEFKGKGAGSPGAPPMAQGTPDKGGHHGNGHDQMHGALDKGGHHGKGGGKSTGWGGGKSTGWGGGKSTGWGGGKGKATGWGGGKSTGWGGGKGKAKGTPQGKGYKSGKSGFGGKGKHTHSLDEALQQLEQFKTRNPDFRFKSRNGPPNSVQSLLESMGETNSNLYKRLSKHFTTDPGVLHDALLPEMAAASSWRFDRLNQVEKDRQQRSADGRSSCLSYSTR
jgi:hypothetical protein